MYIADGRQPQHLEKEKTFMILADKIIRLRKKHGWSQEELAEKMQVSRQAVSKWENGDSFPDTGLLVPISELFGVSVDELLKGKYGDCAADSNATQEQAPTVGATADEKEVNGETPSQPAAVVKIKRAHRGRRKIVSVFDGAIMLSAFFAFLLLGILGGHWHPGWIAFPIGICLCALLGAIDDAANGGGASRFSGFVMLAALVTFLLLGAVRGLWHPGWVAFPAGIVLCSALGAIDDLIKNK